MDGVWRFQDLIAWQRAEALKETAMAICEKPVVKRDYKFHEQLADAAKSGPANIAEGWARHFHPEFARFARIGRASEVEVLNHFIDAHKRGYISVEEFDRADHAAKAAIKVVNGLIAYLEATPDWGRK